MNIFYVYLLLDPRDCYSPFYVGKGKNERWKAHLSAKRLGRNNLKNAIINKIRETSQEIGLLIWQDNMSESDALDLEIQLIKRFGRRDNGTGILSNLTDGGEGLSGYVYSNEQIEKSRERMTGNKNVMFGKTHSNEARENIRKARIKNGGTPHSEEHKQRLRKNNPGGFARSRSIMQFDKNGNLIQTWPSMMMAAKNLNISKGNIGQVATKYKNRLCGGFFWRYVDDSCDVFNENLKIPFGKREATVVPIQQISVNGEIIKTWTSMKSAAKGILGTYGSIWYAVEKRNYTKDIFGKDHCK